MLFISCNVNLCHVWEKIPSRTTVLRSFEQPVFFCFWLLLKYEIKESLKSKNCFVMISERLRGFIKSSKTHTGNYTTWSMLSVWSFRCFIECFSEHHSRFRRKSKHFLKGHMISASRQWAAAVQRKRYLLLPAHCWVMLSHWLQMWHESEWQKLFYKFKEMVLKVSETCR